MTKLEFLRSTNNNSWGVAFSEDGQLFGSTANGCPLVHLAIPNRYYEKVRGLTPTDAKARITTVSGPSALTAALTSSVPAHT